MQGRSTDGAECPGIPGGRGERGEGGGGSTALPPGESVVEGGTASVRLA